MMLLIKQPFQQFENKLNFQMNKSVFIVKILIVRQRNELKNKNQLLHIVQQDQHMKSENIGGV